MNWDLADRVKRLSLSHYRYDAHDLDHLTVRGALVAPARVVGCATWEPANRADAPNGCQALLLHGIYVDPGCQRTGVGSRLLDAAVQAACDGHYAGLLVKANRDAQTFFSSRGLQQLPVDDPERDYPYRYWMGLPERFVRI